MMASGRGDEFANEDMRDAMRELLLPQTTILTPNSIEARRLIQDEENEEDIRIWRNAPSASSRSVANMCWSPARMSRRPR